jgi:HK97 family phage portal protein
MALIERIKGLFSGIAPIASLPVRYSDGWQTGSLHSQSNNTIAGFSALQRGLEVIKGQLLATPLLVYDKQKEALSSSVSRAIRRTPMSHFETAFADMLWTGNGWMKILRDGTGAVYDLECIQAHRMSATLVNGLVEYRLDGVPIDPDDYLHFQCRNNYSPYVGDALIETYAQSVASVVATLSIHNQLQGNGSHAEVYLTTDMNLNVEQMAKLREAYKNQTANGAGNSGGVVILSNGLKPNTIKRLPSALDTDLIKSLEFSVAEASRMTGVPLQYLGVKDSNAYASAVESGREFYRTTIRPIMVRVMSEMTQKLGMEVQFDTGEIALGFGTERAETLSKLLYSGVITANEARASLGYGSVKEGDIFSMPANQLPMDRWVNGTQQQAPAPAQIEASKPAEIPPA